MDPDTTNTTLDTPSQRTTTASPPGHSSSCACFGRHPPTHHTRADCHCSGGLAAGFGGAAGFFALFFFAEVPKVREDIMKKIPILGNYFVHEIAPEDNPY
jgi:hypothetical protein